MAWRYRILDRRPFYAAGVPSVQLAVLYWDDTTGTAITARRRAEDTLVLAQALSKSAKQSAIVENGQRIKQGFQDVAAVEAEFALNEEGAA